MIEKTSEDFNFGTIEYYSLRVQELEKARDLVQTESNYYQRELAKSHEILGRIIHQLSERWGTVHLTKYYPTDNLHNLRNLKNPEGK